MGMITIRLHEFLCMCLYCTQLSLGYQTIDVKRIKKLNVDNIGYSNEFLLKDIIYLVKEIA